MFYVSIFLQLQKWICSDTISLKYGPTHQENIESNHAQLNFIFVSHGKLLMFKSLKCKIFKGIKLHGSTTQGHGTHERKTIESKKEEWINKLKDLHQNLPMTSKSYSHVNLVGDTKKAWHWCKQIKRYV